MFPDILGGPGTAVADAPGVLRHALVAAERYQVTWCLATSSTDETTRALIKLCDLIPNMPEARLLPLIERFTAMLAELPVFANTFGVV